MGRLDPDNAELAHRETVTLMHGSIHKMAVEEKRRSHCGDSMAYTETERCLLGQERLCMWHAVGAEDSNRRGKSWLHQDPACHIGHWIICCIEFNH